MITTLVIENAKIFFLNTNQVSFKYFHVQIREKKVKSYLPTTPDIYHLYYFCIILYVKQNDPTIVDFFMYKQ